MEASEPSGRLTVEDLSDCRSESSHSESQLRAFQDYERVKELNLSVEKSKEENSEPKDFHLGLEPARIHFEDFENAARNLPMTLNKGYIASGLNEMAYPLDRSNENEESLDTSSLCRSKNPSAKDLLFNLREGRQKNTHPTLSLDRYGKDLNFAVSEKDIKDFGLLKNYSLDRMKEFNLSLDRMRDSHIGNFALERLRGGAGLLENPPMMEHNEYKNIQAQPRNQNIEAIALERMRRSHLMGTDLTAQNLSSQLSHPHSITQMQHSQQQQQQQAKSFTIDAILGLRNNPREKRGQQQQYKKHQGQEGGTKNGNSSSCSGGGGKLKRVRTIFTAEQLERLEGEFARQQYMVGPERLYLAHALRLTEAQVKVWFQNRRIKWRKHHHEQQSQRVHEFQRTLNSSLEHEDSNETDKWNLPDSCRGYQNKKVQYSSTSRSGRTPEAVTSCYSSSTSYKPGYVSFKPPHTKCVRPHSSEAAHDGHPIHTKLDKGKHYPSIVPTKGKIRYEDELINNEKFKYVDDELENMTEDNAEEEEDDHADTDEFLNKEYGEHEADDEVEESDSSPQPHRAQRACKKEAELRQLRWKTVGQQEDPRRLRCSQRVLAVGQGHSQTPRYYHHEHEIPEPLSEEDFVPTSMKSSNRRSMDHHHWSPSRGDPIRYDTASLPVQPSRRARTKPDVDQLLEAELGKTRQCHRCGSLSSRKPVSPFRNSCRFNNCTGFPTKGPIGENQESYDQLFCGHCILRHNPELANGVGSHPLYQTKQRKPRDVKSPTKYQMSDQDQIEQLANDYSRTLSKLHRKSTDHERAKRSLHTYGLPHLLSRYED